jgi:hypothetical protein
MKVNKMNAYAALIKYELENDPENFFALRWDLHSLLLIKPFGWSCLKVAK